MATHYTMEEGRSVLASLREISPDRRLRFTEALRIAELQATKLLKLLRVEGDATPSEVVTELPRIRVIYRSIPTSGMSYWDGSEWIICINKFEPLTRQRFTLFHEYKHIVDHGRAERLYATPEQAEQAADYFAGCALMPRASLKRAWGQLIQHPEALARLFDVSARAISVRLAQIGLTDRLDRCSTSQRTATNQRGRYYRALSTMEAIA